MRGDTIVEVIVGIAVLGTALAGAYVASSHNLQQGSDAGNRNRAVAYSQQQVEQLAAADKTGAISAYSLQNPGKTFCIDQHGAYIYNGNQPCSVCITAGGLADAVVGSGSCPNLSDRKLYQVSVIFDASSQVFTTNVTWQAPNGSGQNSTTMYYKLPAGVAAGGGGGGGLCSDPSAMNNGGPLPCQYNQTIIINATIMTNPDLSSPVVVQPWIGGSNDPKFWSLFYGSYGGITLAGPPHIYKINPQPCQDPGIGQVSTSNPNGSPFTFQFDIGDAAKGIVGERCQDATIVADVPSGYTPLKYVLIEFGGGIKPLPFRGGIIDDAHHEITGIIIRSIVVNDGKPHTVAFDKYTTPYPANMAPPKGSLIGAGQYNLLQEYLGVSRILSAFVVN
jgi:hypothetical protein